LHEVVISLTLACVATNEEAHEPCVAFDDLGLDAPALAFGHRPIGHEQRVVGACSIVWLDLGREPVTRPAVLLLLLDGAIFGYD